MEALSQSTYDNLHIVISDDGSPDHSQDVIRHHSQRLIERFGESRVELHLHPKNLGEGPLNNVKFITSRVAPDPRYYCIIDGDDYPTVDRLEKNVRYLLSHPEMDAIHSNCWQLNEDGNRQLFWGTYLPPTAPGYLKMPEGDIRAVIAQANHIAHCTSLGPVEMLKYYDTNRMRHFNLHRAPDHTYLVMASRHFRFGYLNEPLAFYRKLSSSLSHENRHLSIQAAHRLHYLIRTGHI